MPTRLHPDDLVRYRRRDWARVRAAKEAFWGDEARRHGPAAGLRVSEQLWAHARLVDPRWPHAEDRAADFEHHLRLANAFARLADVFANP